MLITRPDLTHDTLRDELDRAEHAAELARTKETNPAMAVHPDEVKGGGFFLGVFTYVIALIALPPSALDLIGPGGVIGTWVLGLIVGPIIFFIYETRRQARILKFLQDDAQPQYVAGRDYITFDMLSPEDQDIAHTLLLDVDTILSTQLPEPQDKLIDHTRNRVVLDDVRWQLAKELFAISQFTNELNELAPEGPMASTAKAKAQKGIEDRRTQVRDRVAVIAAYANEIRAIAARITDLETASRINRITAKLALDTADHTQADESLASLEGLKAAALAVSELHEELS
ncbi:hypothetical protein ABZ644_24855 [Nocardiopsis alba]|uniref:hypothetical protein n=1 Tax=Nocardiopsis alba TaxID=53437 RepID=UPI0033C3DD9A